MICPQCKSEGKKSEVYMGYGYTTSMCCPSYYDEEGRLHDHDGNITTTNYHCSNGHRWTEKTSGKCWCGWPDKEGEHV